MPWRRQADEKAGMVYAAIDQSGGYYGSPVDAGSRSVMNVVFTLPSEALEKAFPAQADSSRTLKSERSSQRWPWLPGQHIYNAMRLEGVHEHQPIWRMRSVRGNPWASS